MAMLEGKIAKMALEKVTVKPKKRQSETGVNTPSLHAAIVTFAFDKALNCHWAKRCGE